MDLPCRQAMVCQAIVCGTLEEFRERGFIVAKGSDTVSDTSSETFNDFFVGLSERMRAALIQELRDERIDNSHAEPWVNVALNDVQREVQRNV